ncbi:cadherin-87A-like isoform X1, partial [Argonauta hians]
GRNVTYKISTNFFDVNKYTGVVTLARNLNYESNKEIPVEVTISDGVNEVPRSITVSVKDTNDVVPTFSKSTYFKKVPEDTKVNDVIVGDIKVTDEDGVNEIISVKCDPGKSHQEDCDTFQVVQTGVSSTTSWEGQIILAKPLNYKTKKSYQVPLLANDGKNFQTQSVEIQVIDLPDSPPYFVRDLPESVFEGNQIGRNITRVIAKDSDTNPSREIRYEIANATLDYFKIDPVTGIITNKVILDREDPNLPLGYIEIPLKAREVISKNPLVLGNSPSTTATTSIKINILDINDNPPVFMSNYTARVPEDIMSGGVVPQLLMTVNDKDSRSNANYSFQVEKYADVFVVYPEYREGLSDVGLKVKNSSLIDYETGPRVYNFQIIAKEINTVEQYSGSTYVTIYVQDANDNAPRVNTEVLTATVPEDAKPGFTAVDDDSGDFGTNGIRYISLKGIGEQLFSLDPITGIITLKECPTPGKSPCLDYEVNKQYDLTVVIVDNRNNRNNAQMTRVDLKLNVTDANDNGPTFSAPQYLGTIFEGKRNINNNILFNQVSDPDSVGTLIFSIKRQEVNGLFVIDQTSGKLTATRPVTLVDGTGDSFYNIEVEVSDGIQLATTKVKIEIIDINNHRPTFSQTSYKKCISEQFSGGGSVMQVQAKDLDKPGSSNSKITYSIVQGGEGLFFIESNGVIRSSFRANFDYETKKEYNLLVMAKDSGFPPLNDTTSVTICINDFNDVIPYLDPPTSRVNIKETIAIGQEIIQLKAYDSDTSAKLQYSFAEPSNAINPNGLTVDKTKNDYTSLFRMDPNNGKIFTAKVLNRDQVSLITHTIQVVDTAAIDQTGTGTIIINILDVNKIPPRFIPPWTPASPFYNVTLNEEQSIGSSVITLNAIDDDGSIEGYKLAETKGYVAADKGVVIVKKRIDFETIENFSFLAYAWDNVEPKMTATATVFVTIKNINDNNPLFLAPIYSFTIEENSRPGQQVGVVSATDLDKGVYGAVRYRIDDPTNSFLVNATTGEIKVKNSAALDREKQEEIIVQVTAYDSPIDQSVRRESTVPVYITLQDQNDNPPVFLKKYYSETVEEGVPIGTIVFEVAATDSDIGEYGRVIYRKLKEDPNDLFSVSASGAISVRNTLINRSGQYSFLVIAYSGQLSSVTNVTIAVVKGVGDPPKWIQPATDKQVVNVLESQYKGMFVYQVKAESPNRGPNGQIKYMFRVRASTSQSTEEFYINPITGVISALRIFDREEQDTYVLQLIAQDSNNNPQYSEHGLIIKILDVNDNKPEFSPSNFYIFQIPEDSQPNYNFGSVVARDRDENDKVYYRIVSGNTNNVFSLDQITGNLSLIKAVDRENISSFSLNIEAMDHPISFDHIVPNHISKLERKWSNLNVAHINVEITDINDEKPIFLQSEYYGCVSTEAGLMQSILTVKAIDRDINSNPLAYSLGIIQSQDNTSINNNTFSIGNATGIIRNQKLMSSYKNTVFVMDIKAHDKADKNFIDKTKGLIFVTEKSQAVKIVLAQPSTEVHYFIPQMKKLISEKTSNSYVCVSDIREHILPNGLTNPHWSDVFIYVIHSENGKYSIDAAPMAASLLNSKKNEDEGVFSGIYIQKIKAADTSDDMEEMVPVIIVMILVAILLVLALILFGIAWCCIARAKQAKIDKVTYAKNLNSPSQEAEDLRISSIYHNKGFFPEDDQRSQMKTAHPILHDEVMVAPASQGRGFISQDEIFDGGYSGMSGRNIEGDISGNSANIDRHVGGTFVGGTFDSNVRGNNSGNIYGNAGENNDGNNGENIGGTFIGNIDGNIGGNNGENIDRNIGGNIDRNIGGNIGGNFGNQHEEMFMAGHGNNGQRKRNLHSRSRSEEQLNETHPRGFSFRSTKPSIFTFEDVNGARSMSQGNLHMASMDGIYGVSSANEILNDMPLYGRVVTHDGQLITPYPHIGQGSGQKVYRGRLGTPYSKSMNDLNEDHEGTVSFSRYDGSGKIFAPYVQEYASESQKTMTPDPYSKSYDFSDETMSQNVSSDQDEMPIYSVVNKTPKSTRKETLLRVPDVIDENEVISTYDKAEPVITASLVDSDEEPQIECELGPEFESEPYERMSNNFPLPYDEPIIVTELSHN